MRRMTRVLAAGAVAGLLWTACAEVQVADFGPGGEARREDAAIEVKLVVVAAFERGADSGDTPGELQYWVERWPLAESLPFAAGGRDLRGDGRGVLAVVTGVGTARAAATVMALGLDPRFDLRRAYWLIAGIAGVDPEDASVGSAAWARFVVDGDLGYEIDVREAPADWPTGYFPRRRSAPYQKPRPEDPRGSVYALDPGLVEWAYSLTREVDLPDSEALAALRSAFSDHPNARRPPFVLLGDNLAAMTFWHGRHLNDWANDWVDYWSDGAGEFVTSAMEDSGTLQALSLLDGAGRVDARRVLLLRSASNYTRQPPSMSAVESLVGERRQGFSAYLPALEALWRVGSPVARELVAGWVRYRERPPGQ